MNNPPCFPATAKRIAVLLKKPSSMREVKRAHALAAKSGLAYRRPILSRLLALSALAPWGSLRHARSLFDSAPSPPSTPLFNTLIRAFSRSIHPLHSLLLYNLMRRRAVPANHFTFPFALKACGRAHSLDPPPGPAALSRKALELHSTLFRLGLDSDSFVQNTLIFVHSQCGRMDIARKVFDEMSSRTIVSWNALIAGYDRCADCEIAENLLQSMPERNVVSWNCTIARYVRMGDIAAAEKVFDQMPERDVVSWNSMIAGYVLFGDYRHALELFRRMQTEEVEPTELTIVSVLGACAETNALEIGREVHEYLKRKELEVDGFVGNALLDMYAKCGSLKAAREVFDGMGMKHVSCWNSMIMGLAVHGHCEEALELFSDMEKEPRGIANPNRVTFLGVLTACSHKGLLKEGQTFFHRMLKTYRIEPDIKHYGCMVDLLSRCGLVREAYRMIKDLPIKANSVLWKAVLSACRVHGDVELAERSFGELAELGFIGNEEYVLMSNIYAEAGRWKDVEQLRTGMIGCSISKPVGYSQIEFG